ncbi:hypothetical protein TNCV_3795511 [Trichonephila clavipes]|nr:hypothetical protein TNCV_3795511 [Trichonephila clavipes]
MGSSLRKLKTKTKRLSGKGKLTDNFIDILQNYYGIAVHSNVGNLNAMQQNVIAALYHSASSGVDITDEMCSIYDVSRLCYRWPLRIFYHLLNTAGHNASIVNHLTLPEKKMRRSRLLEDIRTDRVVLSWISSPPRNWKPFVTNRTSKILDIISCKQWRYVRSKENPADLGSRAQLPETYATKYHEEGKK